MLAVASALTLGASLGLSGCTSGGAAPGGAGTGAAAAPGSASSGTATSPAPGPSAVVARTDIGYGKRAVLHVGVHPVVRTERSLVLTLDVTASDPHHDIQYGAVDALEEMTGGYSADRKDAKDVGVLLMNLTDDRVAGPALDRDGDTVRSAATHRDEVDSGAAPKEQLQLTFGDPGGDALALYLPKAKLIEDVPVIDAAVPKIHGDTTIFGTPEGPADVKKAPVSSLTSYAYDTASRTRTQSSQGEETISLSSDVLFAKDSATLGPDARATISAAAAQVGRHEPGPVTVVGYTDDVRGAAHNQTLSEHRAKAVAERLGSLVDTGKYPLKVSGRGEGSPVASNDTEGGRALNRRVELRISTSVSSSEADAASSGTAENVPVRGTAAHGVKVENGAVPLRLRSPGARKVDGHLVVTIEATRLDKTAGVWVGPNFDYERDDMPSELWLFHTAGGISLMNGSLGTLPALRQDTGKKGTLLPVTDVDTTARLDGGQTRTFDLVYPRGVTVGDTVTVQFPGEWRLTDIPVAQEPAASSAASTSAAAD